MMNRPAGIAIIAVVLIILSMLSILMSMLVFGLGDTPTLSTNIFTLSPGIAKNSRVGVFLLITAVVQFVTAIGLLKIKSWAWYLAIFATGLTVVEGVLGMSSSRIPIVIYVCTGILIPAATLVYLLRPNIWHLYGVVRT
jgi:hypothetical protein